MNDINLADFAITANSSTPQEAFEQVVGCLVRINTGLMGLRRGVRDWILLGGTTETLHTALKNYGSPEVIKSLKYLKQIQTECIKVGMLPEQTYHKSKMAVTADISVENPEALSALLPTSRDVRAYAKAPLEVREQVVEIANTTKSCNEPSIQAVRSLINDDYEIDISGQSKEELGEMLKAHSAEVNGLRFQCTMNDGALEREMKDFGSFNSEGYWYQHKPLTIIKKLIPQLTPDEKRQLIDSLSPTIDV